MRKDRHSRTKLIESNSITLPNVDETDVGEHNKFRKRRHVIRYKIKLDVKTFITIYMEGVIWSSIKSTT